LNTLCQGGYCRKSLRITHGHIGQHLSIQANPGFFHTVDQAAVSRPVQMRCGIDPRDPLAAQLTPASSPVTVCVP
jgi:hypothetical protein